MLLRQKDLTKSSFGDILCKSYGTPILFSVRGSLLRETDFPRLSAGSALVVHQEPAVPEKSKKELLRGKPGEDGRLSAKCLFLRGAP